MHNAAALAKAHWQHWQKIEAGEVKVSLETLARLAKAVNVDAAELLQDPLRHFS